ncbi:MAG: type II secretion system protein GspG [Planctomycetota bacterium]
MKLHILWWPGRWFVVPGALVGLVLLAIALMSPPMQWSRVSPGEAAHLQTQAQCAVVHVAVSMYLHRHGNLPSSLAELLQPDEKNLGEPYLESDSQLMDPWGGRLELRGDSVHFEVVSFGKDHAPGGEGWDADVLSTGGLEKGDRR